MRIKFYLLLLLTIISGTGSLNAQRCASDEVNQALMQRDPNFAHVLQARAVKWAQQNAAHANGLVVSSANGPVYEIPVVVHIMHTGVPVGNINNPTDATVATYIDFLNKTYAAQWSFYNDTNNGGVRVPIKFVLAKRAPGACGGIATTGINRINVSAIYPNYTANGINQSTSSGVDDSVLKSLSIWPSQDYYNIWMVNYIDGPTGGIGGYAYFPGVSSWLDGTVLLAQYASPYSNGSYYYAVPHELGHAFGLLHTFQGGGTSTCPSNANCSTDGDQVCDTEPHINLNNGVCASGTNSCTGLPYAGVQYNFMNYTACPARFTPGQRTKILFNLINYRGGLINSLGTTAPAAFTAPTTACIPTIVNARNNYDMGPHEVSLADMNVSGSGYTNDGYKVYVDHTCTQTAAHVTVGSSYTLSVNTYSNQQNVRAWIDYNNDGTFSAAEMVMSHTGTTGDETHTGTFTIPSTGVTTCTNLRMRVVADWYLAGTLQPCNALQYGQAEDYTVVVAPAVVTPTVAISANPTGSICASTSVTFTATTTNTVSPSYQWKKNGVAVGLNQTTYTNNSWTNNDVITLEVTSTAGCAGTIITTASNSITMAVSGSLTPSVTVSANPGNNICAGTGVTFTANPTNGGTSPTYQWKKNGNIVGGSTATYTDNALINNDVITVVMTSSAVCASPATATSTGITMIVNTVVAPSVTVTTNTGTSVCAGTNVTFTANPTNGGTTPSYQWKKNGANVGINNANYSDNTLSNNDVISVVLTSTAGCASPLTATGSVTMSVSTALVPSVIIAANPGNTICTGTSVTFTATPTNGGTIPTYQWKKNGTVVGSGATYINAAPANNDVITVVMTSNASCVSPATATSNAITMIVGTTVIPSVTIAANPGTTICAGTSVTFTATPVNGGTTPAYQWKKNGVNVGGNTATYTDAALANSNVITVQMASSSSCASPATANSNSLTMTVNPVVTPTVTVSTNTGTTVCAGTQVIFSGGVTNAGATPTYQWKKNGANVGTGINSYGPVTVANNDVITLTLTSSAACASPVAVTSANVTMIVSPAVTPSVTIAAAPGNTICAGTAVTFTATPVNGGANPVYQWKKNGVNVGGNAAIYTDAALANTNTITCVLTSNASCATTTTATSNAITMTVNPLVNPLVSITVNPAGPICAGTPVTFTATPVNGGSAPSYNWQRNIMNVPGNSNVFGPIVLADRDSVKVVLTSNATCAIFPTVTSNVINMTVNPLVTPAVSVTSSATGAICSGVPISFTATATNGGTTPAYQWKLNGAAVGTNSTAYTLSSPASGNVITVELTSNAICATPATVISVPLDLVVKPSVTPSATITVNPGDTICAGTVVTFTATPANEGSNPQYTWRRNGVSVQTASTTYAQINTNDSDIITLELTSDALCATNTHALANIITMRVNDLPLPVITANGHLLRTGSFTAYQWYVNDTAIAGATADTLLATRTGSYKVMVTDAQGCSNTSAVHVNSTVGIGQMPAGNNEVAIFPNPTRGIVYIQSKESAINIRVFTVEGKLVMEYNDVKKIDITHLADGLYTIQIRNKNGELLKTSRLTKATGY